MRVCAHARIWMSQGVRKVRQYLCALTPFLSPFSATPAYQIYTPVLLHSSGSPLPYFCFCAESGEGVHMGYHMALDTCSLKASLTKLAVVNFVP